MAKYITQDEVDQFIKGNRPCIKHIGFNIPLYFGNVIYYDEWLINRYGPFEVREVPEKELHSAFYHWCDDNDVIGEFRDIDNSTKAIFAEIECGMNKLIDDMKAVDKERLIDGVLYFHEKDIPKR